MFTIGCFGDAAAASLTIVLFCLPSQYDPSWFFPILTRWEIAHQTSCLCPATLAAGRPGSALLEAVADIVRRCWCGERRGRGCIAGSKQMVDLDDILVGVQTVKDRMVFVAALRRAGIMVASLSALS